MNRCTVCDITDDNNPLAHITFFNDEPVCLRCKEAIHINLEDLSINDEDLATFYITDEVAAIVEADGKQTPMSEVSE